MSTTTPTVPKTLLQAVNELLLAIRASSVMSLLNEDLNEDASAAKQALDTASVETQSEAWEFNRIKEFIIDPTPGGEIELPSNTLKVTTARWASGNRLVERGGRLYDPVEQTFAIGDSVTVDITLALVFEELPMAARMYVTALAARRFCLPRLPTSAAFNYTAEYLKKARALLEQADADTHDGDLGTTSPHFSKMRRR